MTLTFAHGFCHVNQNVGAHVLARSLHDATDELRGAGGLNGQHEQTPNLEAEMRRLIVNECMSLDGVVQAPGLADEDTSGGFAHGGWHMRYMEDELAQRWVLASIVAAGGFLLGRRTYEIFAA